MAEQTDNPVTSRTRLRVRTLESTDGERHASWLELFFDLVFVLAVAQVAHILSGHADFAGFVKYVVLFVPIWWTWVCLTYYADLFETEETAYRILLFAGMLATAFLAVALENAFTAAGDAPLIACYVLMKLIIVTLHARAAYHIPLARAFNFQFILGCGAAATLLLISLLFAPPTRYVIWALAVVIELLTPFLRVKNIRIMPFDRSHIPERFGLFTIIVLGEAVIATANGAAKTEWNLSTVTAACLGFAMAACVWWINFDFVEDSAVNARSLTPRFVYIYGHFFIVASIVAVGIGVEHAIKETGNSAHLHISTLALIGGGIAAYLATVTLIRFVTGACTLLYPRAAAIAVSLLILFTGQYLPPLPVIGAFLLVLIADVWLESRYVGEAEEEELLPSHLTPCAHAGEMLIYEPRAGMVCEECVKNNYKWVHLRLCTGCGHVGCCDSSMYKHATGHFRETGHPVMASLEANESWAWCYADERFVPLAGQVGNAQSEALNKFKVNSENKTIR